MRRRVVQSVSVAAVILAIGVLLDQLGSPVAGQAPARSSGSGLKTSWGEPDLQGIWTDEFDTPLQRNARFGAKEFFTEEERLQLDKERAALLSRDKRVERGTEL